MSSGEGRPAGAGRRTTEVAVAGSITLGQVLKLSGAVGSGGHAKALLRSGAVTVNGRTEDRRGRKLVAGDMVGLEDRVLLLVEGSARPDGGRSPADLD